MKDEVNSVEPVVVGGLDITKEFVESCDRHAAEQIREAEREQKEAAREAASLGLETRAGTAGEPVAHVHPELYHYWGQREGYEIWSDPHELETFKRDNPEIRPQGKRAPVVNGWRPAPVAATPPRTEDGGRRTVDDGPPVAPAGRVLRGRRRIGSWKL